MAALNRISYHPLIIMAQETGCVRLDVTDKQLIKSMTKRYGRDNEFYFIFSASRLHKSETDFNLIARPRIWNLVKR
jgi:hypothetical protein